MSKKVANANSQPVTIRLVKRASASVGFSDGIKPAGAVDDSVELSFNLDGYTVDDGRFVIGTVDTPNIKNPQSYVDNGNEFQIKNEAGKLSIVANITTNETDPNYTSRTFGLFFRLKSTDGAYVMASPRPTQAVVDYKNNITHVEKVTIKQSVGQWFNDSNYYIPLYMGTLKELFAHWNQTTALGLPELKALGHNSLYNKLNLTVDLPLESVTITNTGDFIIGKTIAITHGYVPVIAKIVKTVYSVDNPAIAEFIGTTNQLNIKSMGTVNVTVTLTDNIGNEMSTVKTFKTTLDYAPLIVKLATNNTAMTIRALGEGSTGYVDWGDNTLTPLTSENVHQYVGTAERTVKLWSSANFTLDLTTANVLTEVVQWGDSPITHALVGSTKLTKVPTTAPTGLIDASSMFKGASIFNQNLNSWDMQQVETMASMFENAGAFNGLVDTWNTGNCTDFTAMFKNAVSFNRPVNAWSMVNALNFSDMFNGATSFNQPISTWRSTVQGAAIACDRMFRGAISFNQSVTGFIDRQYVSFVEMFKGCVNFSQDMSTINFGDTIATAGMFENCTGFNGKVGSFADSELVDASNMFNGCSNFNQPIGELNTSAATNLNGMFRGCTKLNQPANDLVVTNVVSADYMFAGCPVFTSDLSDWNVESLISATGMFQGTSNFDSNLSWWCVSSLPSEPADFATGSFLARSNYPVWGTCPVRGVVIEIDNKAPFLMTGESGTMTYSANKPFTETSVKWESSNVTAIVINETTGEYSVVGMGGVTLTLTVNGIYTTEQTYETIQEISPLILDIASVSGQSLELELDTESTRNAEAYVVWGDGQYSRLTAVEPLTHQYAEDVEAKVKVIPVNVNGSSLIITGDSIRGIDDFGIVDLSITSTALVNVPAAIPTNLTKLKFIGCITLNDSAISEWDVRNLTNFSEMFQGCTAFNQPLDAWKMSEATTTAGMFQEAIAFDKPIGNWDTSKVANMDRMFYNTDYHLRQEMTYWNVIQIPTMPIHFSGTEVAPAKPGDVGIPIWGTSPSRTAVATIVDVPPVILLGSTHDLNVELVDNQVPLNIFSMEWFVSDETNVTVSNTGELTALAEGAVIVAVQVNGVYKAEVALMIALPLPVPMTVLSTGTEVQVAAFSPIKIMVEGGETYIPSSIYIGGEPYYAQTITLPDDTPRKITIQDTFPTNPIKSIRFDKGISKVLSWNESGHVGSLANGGSKGCVHGLSSTIMEVPDFLHPSMTNLNSLFYKADAFNQDISMWDMSQVTTVDSMFAFTKAFNQDLSAWNVSNVTNMLGLFQSAVFNQDITMWDTSKVTTMESMFSGNKIYNQPLNELNVSNVVDLTAMFSRADAFNQDLNLWDVSKVKRMTNMFYFTKLFNGDISNWNTISVDDMGYMFAGAKAFNKPIGDWNTSKVTSMTVMFSENAIFNQPLNTWNTSSVRDMSQMFNKATAFDQSIDLWDVGSVTSMNGMFKGTNYLNMYSLVTWCVKHIGSVPYEFWGKEYPNNNWPVWGTCPVRNAVTTITDIPPYLLVGQTYDLNVTIMNGEIPVTPKYAFWSVSDYNKATIDSGTGVLTTVQVGTVKVSVKLNNYYTAEVTLDILADIP